MKRFLLLIGVVLLVTVSVSAQEYGMAFPTYVPTSGGAWAEVDTAEGLVTFVVPVDYYRGTLGFTGAGYNVTNLTNTTVTGTVYTITGFSYYDNPRSLQCRFARMGSMEVYAPYRNSYGNVSYQWEPLPTTAVRNTNIAFVDDTGGNRTNDAYRYDSSEKVLILIFVSVALLGLANLLKGAWRA